MTEVAPQSNREKDLERDMREFGVKRIPVDYFHINGFRYTDVKDAIAQAKRIRASKRSA